MPKFKKPNLRKKIINLQKNQLPLFANEVKLAIIKRTQSGKDVNQKPFKRYSSEYAKTKKSSRVNLTETGQMLNAIDWKKIRYGIRMYFNSKEQRSKAAGNQKTRKFFGMDTKSKKKLRDQLQKMYFKVLKK